MRRLCLIGLCLLALGACGSSSDEPTSSDSTGSEDPNAGETCEGYSPGQSCITEDNFAQCQQMAAQCPGQVLVMESCPLQFSCPSGAESPDGDEAVANACNGHGVEDECMGEAAFAQCQQMEAQCPGQVQEGETCPVQFNCP